MDYFQTISPEQAQQFLSEGTALLVDIRDPQSFHCRPCQRSISSDERQY